MKNALDVLNSWLEMWEDVLNLKQINKKFPIWRTQSKKTKGKQSEPKEPVRKI